MGKSLFSPENSKSNVQQYNSHNKGKTRSPLNRQKYEDGQAKIKICWRES